MFLMLWAGMFAKKALAEGFKESVPDVKLTSAGLLKTELINMAIEAATSLTGTSRSCCPTKNTIFHLAKFAMFSQLGYFTAPL